MRAGRSSRERRRISGLHREAVKGWIVHLHSEWSRWKGQLIASAAKIGNNGNPSTQTAWGQDSEHVRCVAFGPDETLASGSDDKSTISWVVTRKTGKAKWALKGHNDVRGMLGDIGQHHSQWLFRRNDSPLGHYERRVSWISSEGAYRPCYSCRIHHRWTVPHQCLKGIALCV